MGERGAVVNAHDARADPADLEPASGGRVALDDGGDSLASKRSDLGELPQRRARAMGDADHVVANEPGVRGQHEIRRVTLETTCRFT